MDGKLHNLCIWHVISNTSGEKDLKIEAEYSLETVGTTCTTMWFYSSEYHNVRFIRHANLKYIKTGNVLVTFGRVRVMIFTVEKQ